MELRPRKGRSAQTPSTPTPAKPSSRTAARSTSRKTRAIVPSSPILVLSDDEGTDPKQPHVHVTGSLLAPSVEKDEISIPAGIPEETPVSNLVKSRRERVTSTTKKKKKGPSIITTTVSEVSSVVSEQGTFSMEEACTENYCNVTALEIVQLENNVIGGQSPLVADTKAAEIIKAKASIELDEEKSSRKDRKTGSAKKKRSEEGLVKEVDNGELLPKDGYTIHNDQVGEEGLSTVVADAPVTLVANESNQRLLLVLSEDEDAEASGAINTPLSERKPGQDMKSSSKKKSRSKRPSSEGKPGEDLKSSSKKKSRSKRGEFSAEIKNRKLFEEKNSPYRDRARTGKVANSSGDDETQIYSWNLQEFGEVVSDTREEQAGEGQSCEPGIKSSKENLSSETLALGVDEPNLSKPDEAASGEELGVGVVHTLVPEGLTQKQDSEEEGEEPGNKYVCMNVSEESSDKGCERGQDLGNGHDDSELKFNASKENSLQTDGDHSDEASSGSDEGEDKDDLASVFANSMKAHLHILEPSVLSRSRELQSEPDMQKGREGFSNKVVANGSHASGKISRSGVSGLSWLPKVAFSTSKKLRPEAEMSQPRPSNLWDKDRCLQDGLCVPPRDPMKLNRLAKKQKKDTAGDKWYNLSAPTITPDLKKELQLVKLRGVLDPKRHYKAEDSKGLPKYFQVGTVIGGPADFYSGRLTKKEQKGSLANELLSDSSVSTYRKRKYLEIQDQKQAGGKGFWKKKKSKRTPAWAKI